MNNNTNCIVADRQKEVFDNLCKNKWDEKLQSKFGEYADIICNITPTIDGGETYLTVGIYDIKEELVNFSEELSSILGVSNDRAKSFLERYIEIFNISADIDWNEKEEKAEISISLDEPYTDELTDEEDLMIIRNEEKMLISEKLADCLEKFIETLMHDADVDFGYKWREWTTCNPEY